MKRHSSLEPFSRDHNEGLILARRLDLDGVAALPALRECWDREMRDHFKEEERLLVPLCDSSLVTRLRDEHRQIETLIETAATDDEARRLGELLHDHIRWEERELFVRIEEFGEATLRSLAEETERVERKRTDLRRTELVGRRPKPSSEPPMANLRYLAAVADAKGPQWGLDSEDLNATLLMWHEGEGVPAHVNDELDVLVIGIEGCGKVVVDGETFSLGAGETVLIPKGASRSLIAQSARFAYLNVHRRRRKLAIDTIPKRTPHGSERSDP